MKSMKNIVAIAATAITLILTGCAKDGIQGPAGTNGNANVKVYYYSNDSMSGPHDFNQMLPLKKAVIDSSLVLVYYIDGNYPGAWYWCPGLGYQNAYQTKPYIYGSGTDAYFIMRIQNSDGTGYSGPTVMLDKVKIVIVPGSTFGKKDPVDYSDYKATMKYYGLSE